MLKGCFFSFPPFPLPFSFSSFPSPSFLLAQAGSELNFHEEIWELIEKPRWSRHTRRSCGAAWVWGGLSPSSGVLYSRWRFPHSSGASVLGNSGGILILGNFEAETQLVVCLNPLGLKSGAWAHCLFYY